MIGVELVAAASVAPALAAVALVGYKLAACTYCIVTAGVGLLAWGSGHPAPR